jgi:hypothetical protein
MICLLDNGSKWRHECWQVPSFPRQRGRPMTTDTVNKLVLVSKIIQL